MTGPESELFLKDPADLLEDAQCFREIRDRRFQTARTDLSAILQRFSPSDRNTAGKTSGQLHTFRAGKKRVIHGIDPPIERSPGADGTLRHDFTQALPGTIGLVSGDQIPPFRLDRVAALGTARQNLVPACCRTEDPAVYLPVFSPADRISALGTAQKTLARQRQFRQKKEKEKHSPAESGRKKT